MSLRKLSFDVAGDMDAKVWKDKDGFYSAIVCFEDKGGLESVSSICSSRDPMVALGHALSELGDLFIRGVKK